LKEAFNQESENAMKSILSQHAADYLLQLARLAVAAAVNRKQIPQLPPPPAGCEKELSQKCGMFVTLKRKGDLRGCIGIFTSDLPVGKQVLMTARDSALNDFRFAGNQVQTEELADLDISISLLGELSKTDDPDSIVIGEHGIVVTGKGKYTGRRGVFLPQVATEHNLDVPTFWNWVCSHKAGLPENAWKHPDLCQCEIFTAQIIGKD
jgi:uncharacterized protein